MSGTIGHGRRAATGSAATGTGGPGGESRPAGGRPLVRGVAGGTVVAALAAVLLATAILMTGRSTLWMAAGAGILVGHGVRLFGKDDRLSWGIVGAALTLACCLAGNLLAGEVAASPPESVPLGAYIVRCDPGTASAILGNALRPACLASYAFAVAIGYAVVREERIDESFLRLAARYRQ